MFKIGQNWGKIANYPSNAQPKSARLPVPLPHKVDIFSCECERISLEVIKRAWPLYYNYFYKNKYIEDGCS